MSKIYPSPYFKLLEPERIACNWDTNLARTVIPTHKNLKTRNAIANSINHLSGFSPRTIFSRVYDAWTVGYEYSGAAQIATWLFPDYWAPGTEHELRINGWIGVSSEVEFSVNGSSDYVVSVESDASGDPSRFDCVLKFPNTVTNAEKSQYLSATSANFWINSIVVQEVSQTTLDSANSAPGVYRLPKTDYPVLSAHIEECRDALHDIYSNYYPLVYWFSSADEDTLDNWTSQQAGDEGWLVTATSEKNIFDLSSTSRTISTPGVFIPAFGCGLGAGTTVRCHCRVRAKNYNFGGSDTGTVRFIGPNGSTTITLDAYDASFTWHGSTSNYITLNTDKDWNEATTAMNKIDILAKVDQVSTGIFISSIVMFLELIP